MSEKKIVYVCHGMYGCETGCCGHRLCLDDEGFETVPGTGFVFSHPAEDQSAEDFAREEWDGDIDVETFEVREGKWYPGWNC